MNRLNTYVVVWVCGLIAGLIAVERWRRIGHDAVASTPSVVSTEPLEASGTDAATPTAATPTTATPKLTERIVSGAKSDFARARQLLSSIVPG